MARSFPGPAAIVIKHNNPCGAATADTLAAATRAALDGDPVSAFGSVLGFNRSLDADSAETLAEPGRFIEAIVAPDFSPEAQEILTTRPKWKANVRLLAIGACDDAEPETQCRAIAGGFLVQRATFCRMTKHNGRSLPGKSPARRKWPTCDSAGPWSAT